MSQLDLSLAAGVSTRHISFLETGRSRPSVEMVSLFGEVLDVPLRSRNDLMRAAGFEPSYPEPTIEELLASPLRGAIDALLEHADPFPILVLDRWYGVVLTNRGGRKLLKLAGINTQTDEQVNLLKILFDPSRRQVFTNWEQLAGQVLRRLQRLALRDPSDEQLAALLAELLDTPGLPKNWRAPDLSERSDPMMSIEIQVNGVRLRFLITITVFAAPDNVTLEELLIESYLPLDQDTREFFT